MAKSKATRQREYRRRRAERNVELARKIAHQQGIDLPPDALPTASFWGKVGNAVKKAKREHYASHRFDQPVEGCPLCKAERGT